MKTRRFAVVAALAAVFLAAPAQAQMFSGLTQELTQTRMLLAPVEGLAAQSRARASREKTPPKRNATPAAKQAAPAASTRYTASPAVTTRVKRQFVAWLKTTGGADAQAERAILEADLLGEWAAAVREDGLRPGDTADALAAYWLLNWMMANGRTSNTAAEAQAVRNQCRQLLSANPTFARFGDAHKQELSEVWMMNFLLQGTAWLDSVKRGDAVLRRKLGEAAVARFRNEMGVDLSRLRLTPDGLVPA